MYQNRAWKQYAKSSLPFGQVAWKQYVKSSLPFGQVGLKFCLTLTSLTLLCFYSAGRGLDRALAHWAMKYWKVFCSAGKSQNISWLSPSIFSMQCWDVFLYFLPHDSACCKVRLLLQQVFLYLCYLQLQLKTERENTL